MCQALKGPRVILDQWDPKARQGHKDRRDLAVASDRSLRDQPTYRAFLEAAEVDPLDPTPLADCARYAVAYAELAGGFEAALTEARAEAVRGSEPDLPGFLGKPARGIAPVAGSHGVVFVFESKDGGNIVVGEKVVGQPGQVIGIGRQAVEGHQVRWIVAHDGREVDGVVGLLVGRLEGWQVRGVGVAGGCGGQGQQNYQNDSQGQWLWD